MSSGIIQQMERFRNVINQNSLHSAMRKDGFFDGLCAAMDVVEDCQWAIEDYSSRPFPEGQRAGYIPIYGLLQAMYMQQEAIFAILKHMGAKKEEKERVYDKRGDTIIHRNNITHAVNAHHGNFIHLIQSSLKKDSFEYVMYNKHGDIVEEQKFIVKLHMELQYESVSEGISIAMEYLLEYNEKHKSYM